MTSEVRIERQGAVATVAIESMKFISPILMGDLVSVYTEVTRVGRTSMTLHVETWVTRQNTGERSMVTEGDFTFVAISSSGIKRVIPPEDQALSLPG